MRNKIFLFLLAPFFAFSYYPTQPYLSPLFEFQLYMGYTQQRYSHIDEFRLKVMDHYFDGTLSIAITPVLEVGLEGSVLKTTNRNVFMDMLGGYLRYLVLDDIVGDYVSMTLNLELLAPFKKALTTFGRFYQGRFEAIASTSIGKEFSCGPFLESRWWLLAGIGISDKGSWFSPFELWWQLNYDWFRFSLFGLSDIGWGDRKFNLATFKGYQKIQYRAVDLGANIIFKFGIWGDLTIEYARRIYGKLAPERVNRFTAIYHLPFSIF